MLDVVHTGLTAQRLDAAAICKDAHDPRCGAVAMFQGTVRDHSGGATVAALEYTAHPSAARILRSIAEGLTLRQGVHRVEAWHRTGLLDVGDVLMVVAVAAEHRSQAFAAAEAMVDEVKARLPVWKKQIMADGSHSWSGLESA